MRLIDADKTIGLLKTRLYETALNNATVNCDASYLYTECADNRIKTWIDEIPTIDPVKHGKWIELSEAEYKCSACGSWYGGEYGDEVPTEYAFCPRCGAVMERSEE